MHSPAAARFEDAKMNHPMLAFFPSIGPFELLAIAIVVIPVVVAAIVAVVLAVRAGRKGRNTSTNVPPPLPAPDQGDDPASS